MKTFKFSAILLALTTTYAASAGGHDAFTGFSLGINAGYQMNTVKYKGESYKPKFFNAALVGRYGLALSDDFVGFAELTLGVGGSKTFSSSSHREERKSNGGTFDANYSSTNTVKISQPFNFGAFVGAGYQIEDIAMPYVKVGFNFFNFKLDITAKDVTAVYASGYDGGNGKATSRTKIVSASLETQMFAPAVGIGSRFLINDALEAGLDYQASWGSSKGVKVNSHTVSANLSYRF